MTPSESSGLNLQDTQGTWSLLAERIQSFASAWEQSSEPPRLAAHVVERPALLRQIMLREVIKVDMKYRWRRGLARRLEEYQADFPELGADLPCDLLFEELQVRRQAGETVEPEEYFEKYPRQAAELKQLLGMSATCRSTTILHQDLTSLEPGTQLGDFDLLVRLGVGSFARVFLARQRSLQRLVALKVSADKGSEAQTLARLDHAGIVRVYDQHVLAERGLRLLYMQYVPGGTLGDVIQRARLVPAAERSGRLFLQTIDQALERRGEQAPAGSALRGRVASLDWPRLVCWLGAQVARALDYAHRQGVLHRDIKPANILLGGDGVPRLADFNVSSTSGSDDSALFGGTFPYMSPEQLDVCHPDTDVVPEDLDPRADIYSLGVVLWELLTGRLPFPDDHLPDGWAVMVAELARRRRAGVPGPSRQALPSGCPSSLERILLRCLEPNPEQRYANGADLARELELCLHPRVQELFEVKGGWRLAVLRFPIVALLAVCLLPNTLATIFNVVYNRGEIIRHLEDAMAIFWNVMFAINSLAFPLGIAIIVWVAWPVARQLHLPQTDRPAAELEKLRQRCLNLGHLTALICISEWVFAGLAFPISLHVALGTLPVSAYLHFIASLVLCGLVAAVYPFFGVSFLAVRVFYPALLRQAPPGPQERDHLRRLSRLTWIYLLLSAAVPLLSVAVMSVLGSENRAALTVASGGGLAGLGLAFVLVRTIQADLADLTLAVRLPEDHHSDVRLPSMNP